MMSWKFGDGLFENLTSFHIKTIPSQYQQIPYVMEESVHSHTSMYQGSPSLQWYPLHCCYKCMFRGYIPTSWYGVVYICAPVWNIVFWNRVLWNSIVGMKTFDRHGDVILAKFKMQFPVWSSCWNCLKGAIWSVGVIPPHLDCSHLKSLLRTDLS